MADFTAFERVQYLVASFPEDHAVEIKVTSDGFSYDEDYDTEITSLNMSFEVSLFETAYYGEAMATTSYVHTALEETLEEACAAVLKLREEYATELAKTVNPPYVVEIPAELEKVRNYFAGPDPISGLSPERIESIKNGIAESHAGKGRPANEVLDELGLAVED